MMVFDNSYNFGYDSIYIISTGSHDGKSASFAFFDGHCEAVASGAMIAGGAFSAYCVNGYATSGDISNEACFYTDLRLKNTNTGQPSGYWTAVAGD